eukprot:bmy_04307T0
MLCQQEPLSFRISPVQGSFHIKSIFLKTEIDPPGLSPPPSLRPANGLRAVSSPESRAVLPRQPHGELFALTRTEAVNVLGSATNQAGVHTALFWICIVTYREALTMSGALDVLQMKGEDVLKFLAAGTHLGGTNLDFQMEQHVYKRKSDGIYIINLKRTWEKLLLAARAIVAIENPAGVSVVSSRNTGQRAGLKFAAVTGATSVAGRFTPGTFTNQIQAAFREPRLPVVTDPRADHLLLTEASYANLPTVALCDTDSPL